MVLAPFAVKWDPEEHQRFVWATKQEAKAKRADGIDLDFTNEAVRRTNLQTFNYFKVQEVESLYVSEETWPGVLHHLDA